MTMIAMREVACALCGQSNTVRVVQSTNTFGGSPDLDTRPPEMMRSTIFSWVHRCAGCGYCASDLGKADASAEAVVASELYRAQLEDRSAPELAASFACHSLVLEGAGEVGEAAMELVHAAWACDDAGDRHNASRFRVLAAVKMQEAHATGDVESDPPGVVHVLTADLFRRAGVFDGAKKVLERAEEEQLDDTLKRVVRFQWNLVGSSDTAKYTVEDVA